MNQPDPAWGWPDGAAYAAVLREIFRDVPGPIILVEEYSASDGLNVAGDVVRAWVVERGQFRPIPADERTQLSDGIEAAASHFPMVHASFHVYPGGREVAFGFMVSRRSGGGGRYRVVQTGDAPALECTARWLV